ncbi:hypothetical protein CD58_14170 [Pseudomonas brassicacearum]|nr:hypothetical protein CD58_14170 [Pseudomonas brassicacearum]
MRILKALLLPALLVLSLIGVDRLSGKQGMCDGHRTCKQPGRPVGAGLLAKTAVQSTPMQADPPLSRASPLPQGICVRRWGCDFIPAMGR